MIRVADYIAEHLEKIGVEKVFLLSGGGMMHLLDAISRREKIQYICNHHEQASGIAADAYARVSGKLGVCYATSGPGGTNTITALAGAHQDSTPVLFITGQSKVSQTIQGRKMEGLRQFGTFEVDIIPVVQSLTKYAAFIDDASLIRYHLEKAIHLAFDGRPGAVFLDVPVDIQGRLIDPTQLKGFTPELKSQEEVDLTALVEQFSKAKKPLILAGYGVRVAGAETALETFAKKYNVPIVTTCFGKDVIGYDNKLFIGHPGMKGDRAGNFAVQNADFILTVGASLHVTTTGYELDQFAKSAFKALVDPDPFVLNREEVGVNLKIQTDVGNFFKKINSHAGLANFSGPDLWVQKCQGWKEKLSVYKEPHKLEKNEIGFYNFCESLDSRCASNDIVVTDAGSAFYVIGQAFRVKSGQRVINSGSLGAMGFAVPAATGSALAAPERRVICVTGDGSLQTNIHELAVFKRYGLNVKLFVVNNDGYVCIRNTQNNFFNGQLAGTSYDSGVFIPNTKKIAEAYELPYFSTRSFSELGGLIDQVLAAPGPVVCEIFTPSHQEIIPTVSSVKLPDGSMKSKPLDDMYPFMSEEERAQYLN